MTLVNWFAGVESCDFAVLWFQRNKAELNRSLDGKQVPLLQRASQNLCELWIQHALNFPLSRSGLMQSICFTPPFLEQVLRCSKMLQSVWLVVP